MTLPPDFEVTPEVVAAVLATLDLTPETVAWVHDRVRAKLAPLRGQKTRLENEIAERQEKIARIDHQIARWEAGARSAQDALAALADEVTPPA